MSLPRHGIASPLMAASMFFCATLTGTASERRPFAGFTLLTLDGQSFVWKERVSAQRAVVLTFFTTWCAALHAGAPPAAEALRQIPRPEAPDRRHQLR